MKTITFRPDRDNSLVLPVLMEVWGCNRSQAINRAIREAGKFNEPSAGPDRPFNPDPPPSSPYPAAAEALPGRSGVLTQKSKPLTRAEREARVEEFQRKMARKGK